MDKLPIAANKPSRIVFFLRRLSLWMLVCWLGCGGMDHDDIRKYAIKRPKDDDGGPIPDLTKKPPVNPPTNPTINPAALPKVNPTQNKQANTPQVKQPNTTNVVARANNVQQPAPNQGSQPQTTETVNSSISDTISPGAPIDSVERRRRTISNLQRIEQAMHAYFDQNNRYPPAAIFSPSGQPILSWRVALLPYLGYQQLFDQIQKAEPWNGLNNQKLLAKIPSVYQSPERYDDHTNYVVPYGSSAAFFGKKGKVPRRWEDGRENVALILEVDDSHAVPWMKPADLEIDIRNPKNGLGNLREDGFFVVFGNGQLARIAATTSPKDIKAMFTVDAGEPFSAGMISLAATPEFERPRRKPRVTTTTNSPTTVQTVSASSSSSNASTPRVSSVRRDAEYFEKLSLAYQIGEAEIAQKMCYLGLVTDRLDSIDAYKWISGLRRPSPFVRIGVSVDYSGPKNNRLSEFSRENLQSSNWHSQRGKVVSIAGDLAEEILTVVERITPTVPIEISNSMESQTTRTRRPHGAGTGVMSVVGASDRNKMLRFAAQNGVDVLIHFDAEDRKTRTGKTNPRASVHIFDVRRRKILYRSPSISYRQRENQQSDPLFDDPVADSAKRVEQLFSKQLVAEPLPSELRSKHALARTESLSRSRDNILSSLAEIDLYAKLELLTLDQKFEAYEALLSRSQALALVTNDMESRDKVLDEFVPRFDPKAHARAIADDDDD